MGVLYIQHMYCVQSHDTKGKINGHALFSTQLIPSCKIICMTIFTFFWMYRFVCVYVDHFDASVILSYIDSLLSYWFILQSNFMRVLAVLRKWSGSLAVLGKWACTILINAINVLTFSFFFNIHVYILMLLGVYIVRQNL